MKYYNKSLAIFIGITGENTVSVAQTIENIGILYYNIKNYDLAIECIEKAYNISLNILGEEDVYTNKVKRNLEIVRKRLGK